MSKEGIKSEIIDLLKSGKIKSFVGYEKGTNPFFLRPLITSSVEEVKKADFSVLCVSNLVRYVIDDFKIALPRGKTRDSRPIAVVVKGCDSRAVNVLLQEHIIKRSDVFLIGMPCNGVIDPKAAESLWYERNKTHDPTKIRISNEGMFEIADGKEEIKLADFDEIESEKCKVCMHNNPVIYDELVWDKVDDKKVTRGERYKKVDDYEKLDPEKKWLFWSDEFSKCIRCYGCKNICPLCYCEECTLAKDKEKAVLPNEKIWKTSWIDKEVNFSNNVAYHMNRAMHLAGRCVDCGECERACPVDIPLRLLYTKVEKDIYERYGYESGMDSEVKPVLATFDINDKEEFIEG
ncbi:MAG TPA: coenzyme F420 hydrogenase [Thermoplasmata archaeon]|nr:coenzyme F420 hydrogenase [Thermoplasmata archaeon]